MDLLFDVVITSDGKLCCAFGYSHLVCFVTISHLNVVVLRLESLIETNGVVLIVD